ncbi:MAG: helix-turn-helix domain-containing protein [Vicinamibacterales bacterium]
MTEQETFTTRLRRHRERSRIALDEISRDTRVKRELLEGLEKNDLSAWPRGLYARAYIRAYSAAIGLDGDDTVNEFCRLFPHGDRRAEPVIREIAEIVASQSEFEYDYKYATESDRRRSPQAGLPPLVKTPLETAVSRLRTWIGAIGRWPVRDTRSPKGLRHPL